MKRFCSAALIVFSSASLVACASLPEIRKADALTEVKTNSDRLPPQNLPPGTCGLFIWTADTSQTFIGFETDKRVKLILDGKRFEGRPIAKEGVSFPDRIYSLKTSDDGEIDISVSLVEDKEIAEGTRYYGRIKSITENGWERLTPIVALYSCVSET